MKRELSHELEYSNLIPFFGFQDLILFLVGFQEQFWRLCLPVTALDILAWPRVARDVQGEIQAAAMEQLRQGVPVSQVVDNLTIADEAAWMARYQAAASMSTSFPGGINWIQVWFCPSRLATCWSLAHTFFYLIYPPPASSHLSSSFSHTPPLAEGVDMHNCASHMYFSSHFKVILYCWQFLEA